MYKLAPCSHCKRSAQVDIPRNNILVLPSNLVAESANRAVLASGLQSQDSQGLGNNHSLDFVVWWWDTLEDLESLHGSGATSGLVGNHTADGLVEDSRRGTEMEGTCCESDAIAQLSIRGFPVR